MHILMLVWGRMGVWGCMGVYGGVWGRVGVGGCMGVWGVGVCMSVCVGVWVCVCLGVEGCVSVCGDVFVCEEGVCLCGWVRDFMHTCNNTSTSIVCSVCTYHCTYTLYK